MQFIHSIKRFVSATTVGAITLGIVPWVMGDVKTFVPGSGNWHVAGNWSPSGVPTEADRVIIPEGKICSIADDAEADTIVVEADAQLTIQGGHTLTLDNDDPHGDQDPDHSIVDGQVRLEGEDDVLLFAENDHSITGDGQIWGRHNNARIDIDADVTFSSHLGATDQGIRGQLIIRGLTGGSTNGRFVNHGIVSAGNPSGGTLELHEDTVVEDASSVGQALWRSEFKNGILLFSTVATGLNGDFNPTACGRLHISADVKTCGTFIWDGYLVVDDGVYFAYVGYSSPNNCSNPGTPPNQDPPDCANPYMVYGPFGLTLCSMGLCE